MKQGGSIANETGKILEEFVNDTLLRKGYQFVTKNKFDMCLCLRQKIYTRQKIVAQTIYNTNWKVDFIVHRPDKEPVIFIVECKWQQDRGSVDEKYPYLVHNIKEKLPYAAIILLDGGGYKPRAETWLKAQIDKKLLGVFSMGEFTKWSNLGNL